MYAALHQIFKFHFPRSTTIFFIVFQRRNLQQFIHKLEIMCIGIRAFKIKDAVLSCFLLFKNIKTITISGKKFALVV